MKSFDQLAHDAYAAYFKKAVEIDEEGLAAHATPWAELQQGTRDCWIAATKQLWAEMALVH